MVKKIDDFLMATIEDAIKEREPKAKEFSYTGQDPEYFEVIFKKGNKKHTIKLSNSIYWIVIAEYTKKMEKLNEWYVKMRLEFDEKVNELTKDLKAEYKPQFDKFNTDATELEKQIDIKTKEWLKDKINNYFTK